MEFITHRSLSRLGLNGKFVLVVILSVVTAIAVLVGLIIRRETALLLDDSKKNAEVLALSLGTSVKESMLSGRPEEAKRFIRELSKLPGVHRLGVVREDGSPAFDFHGAAVPLGTEFSRRLKNGEEILLIHRDFIEFLKPIMYEQRCRPCHAGGQPLLGAISVGISTAETTESLKGFVRRVVFFGIVSAAVLAALLIIFGRKLIVTPIRRLKEASYEIARGNYVLLDRRGVRCWVAMKCEKKDCPSHGDENIPCWLRKWSEGSADPGCGCSERRENCLKCRVYQECRGDEVRQMEDAFNSMSIALKRSDDERRRHIEKIQTLCWDLEGSYIQTVAALVNAMEARDPYTKGHSVRVANISAAIAGALGLKGEEMEHLHFAALLHDVGKIGIEREILHKRRDLDEIEETKIRMHPEQGARILSPIHFLKPAIPIIRHHHERYDGTGYPLGLKEAEIPLMARILCVADAWDAMRSDRPYRKALSITEARAELLQEAGKQFDPQVVAVIVKIVSEEDSR